MHRSEQQDDIPELTRLVARAAFPEGNAVRTMRDELRLIFEDVVFASLYPKLGQPAESPGRFVLGCVDIFSEAE